MTDRHTEFARQIVLAIAPILVESRSRMTYEQLGLDYQKIFREGDSQEARKQWEATRNAQMTILEKDISIACGRLAFAIADEVEVQGGQLSAALRKGISPPERMEVDLTKETL